jgi:hypothetical protein
MHPADELRALAKRFRILAEVGPQSHREDRLRWAECLERQAEQLQPRTMNAIRAAVAAGVI